MIIKGSVKEKLRKELLEIGFDEVRFAELDPAIPNRLKDWVGNGYHADMDWFARSLDKRIDPKRVLDSACSAIMLGTNYWPTDSSAARQSRWAKYSLYKDYHDTILKGLKKAASILESSFGLIGSHPIHYVFDGSNYVESSVHQSDSWEIK